MKETTKADREHELKDLLEQMKQHPERDWSEAKKRVNVLRELLAHED